AQAPRPLVASGRVRPPEGGTAPRPTAPRPTGCHGVLPRRWAVKRPFSRLGQSRRLSKDDGRSCETSGAPVPPTVSRVMVKRSARAGHGQTVSRVGPSSRRTASGGRCMHPFRRLREAGAASAADYGALLAEDVVFHSPIFVQAVIGRDKVAPLFV